MLPAAPAIHYRVTVECGGETCAFPIHARTFGGGGSPTPVPPQFSHIRLIIDPALDVEPAVTWRSLDDDTVKATFTSPVEKTLRLPDDTEATPVPDELETLLVPGNQGTTFVEADIGAPINERVYIPVYSAGTDPTWHPPAIPKTNRLSFVALPPKPMPPLTTTIAYADPIAPTYGSSNTFFTEVPWQPGTGGFIQPFGRLRVAFSQPPASNPEIDWTIDGDSATLADGRLRGVHPGTAMIHASVGPPFNKTLTATLVTYPTLVLACGHGARFSPNGVEFTADARVSDLFVDCRPALSLQIPGGAVLLTNGDDPQRNPAPGALRGPQFPDLTSAPWRYDFTTLDGQRYASAIQPCDIPQANGTVRIDWSCTTMPARTLLFRTRDGHVVKWLMQIGNGLNALAGPYQVL